MESPSEELVQAQSNSNLPRDAIDLEPGLIAEG